MLAIGASYEELRTRWLSKMAGFQVALTGRFWVAPDTRVNRIYVCFDGDSEGRKGARRAAQKIGPQSRIVDLPDGLDPNEFLQQFGGAEFDELVEASLDPIRHQLRDIAEDSDKTELPKLLDSVLQQLAALDETTAEAYLTDVISPRFELGARATNTYRKRIQETRTKTEASESARTGANGSSARPTQAQILIELAQEVEFFSTQDHVGFATFPVRDHNETWPIQSTAFRRWLTRKFYRQESKPPGSQALQDTLLFLGAKAQFDCQTRDVYTRVAHDDGKIYIDLGNETWSAVEISAERWQVIDEAPVKFRRSPGMLPLPRPERGGSITSLKSVLNYGDTSNWILIIAWLLAALQPAGPYPVLIIYGEHGSAKSTQARLLRSLIDPSLAPLRTAPRSDRDLMIAARNARVIALDNLSFIPQWLSDALCRLATGGGLTTRRLYTDDEEEIFDATRPVILNSIETVAVRSDLVDRALIVNLPSIPQADRRPDKEVVEEFNDILPGVLGALFDAVVYGLWYGDDDFKIDNLPRMADFAKWVVACEQALPWAEGKFMEVYSSNRADAVDTTIEADVVASTLRDFMQNRPSWEGTPSTLLNDLEETVDERVQRSKTWPGSASWLTQRLRRQAPFLRSTGIDIVFPSRGKTRKILIRNTPQNGDGGDEAPGDRS